MDGSYSVLDERGCGLHGVGAGYLVLDVHGTVRVVLNERDRLHAAAGGGLHVRARAAAAFMFRASAAASPW